MDVILDGLNARTEQGLQLAARPNIPIASEEVEIVDVPGARRSLTIKQGYKSYELPVVFNYMNPGGVKDQLRQATAWLKDKERLAFDDDLKFYKRIQRVTFEPAENDLKQYAKVTALFLIEPLWYKDDGSSTITTAGTITNPSTVEVQPVIRVYGTGDITLNVNDQVIELTNVTDELTIDGINENATVNGVDANDQMAGPFPVLKPGQNDITVTGASRIEVDKRWAFE